MVSIDVSKVSVSKIREKLYCIVLNLLVKDGETTLINKNFSQLHKIGHTPAYTINKFYVVMQTCISDYISEMDIYNSAALDSAISTLEGNLAWQ